MFTGIIEWLGVIIKLENLNPCCFKDANTTSTVHIDSNKQLGDCKLTVQAPASFFTDLKLGESIAIDGACMTIIFFDAKELIFSFYVSLASQEILKPFVINQLVNLEKSLQLNSRLSGSIVSGHIDTTAKIKELKAIQNSYLLQILLNIEFDNFIIYKGSITLNGVNLTINKIDKEKSISHSNRTKTGSSLYKLKETNNTNLSENTSLINQTISIKPSNALEKTSLILDINLITHTFKNTSFKKAKVGDLLNVELDIFAKYINKINSNNN